MNTRNRLILLSLMALLAVGCDKQVEVSKQPTAAVLEQPQNIVPTPAITPTPKATTAVNPTPTPSATPIEKVTDYIKYSGEDGKNALDLLKAGHQVGTKTFGGIGEFVESIDGNKADSKHFWEFFVNGKSSNVGASSYISKTGDVLEWKLSIIN